ncbi:lipocalin-like [Pelodytes ibericus]
MKGLMFILGLVAVCALGAQAKVATQPDYQQSKMVGNWYSIALASNSPWFQSKKAHMKMCKTVISPRDDGNLEVVATYPKLEGCEKRTLVYTKTDQPGYYTSTGIRPGTSLHIYVVDTDYENFSLLFTQITKDGEVNSMVSLFGKEKEVSPELLEKFTKLTLKKGLTGDKMLILPQTEDPVKSKLLRIFGSRPRFLPAVYCTDNAYVDHGGCFVSGDIDLLHPMVDGGVDLRRFATSHL